MAGKGWVSLHRELIGKPIWLESTPEQKTILITLLLMANHASNKWEWRGEQYVVEPGQFVTSVQKIADKSGKGISVQNVKTAIKRFEKYNFLTNESTKQNRLITIVNWAFYQGEEGRSNQRTNRQLTDDQPTINRQLTTNNNVNNLKNDKNVDIYNSRRENSTSDEVANSPIFILDQSTLSKHFPSYMIEILEIYAIKYSECFGINHPRLKLEQLNAIYEKINEVDSEVHDWVSLINYYFTSENVGDGNINRLFNGKQGEGVIRRIVNETDYY